MSSRVLVSSPTFVSGFNVQARALFHGKNKGKVSMCGRFALPVSVAAIEQFISMQHILLSGYEPSYNVAPGSQVPVITESRNGRVLENYRWGLIPFWAKEEQVGYKMINARSETAAEKPSFKNPWKNKRCVVPVSGFYEWKKEEGGKIPWYITEVGVDVSLFAGLWDSWRSPSGAEVKSFTIVTKSADEFMSSLHHRMPVILTPELADLWLTPGINDPGRVGDIVCGCSPELQAWPVDRYVNSPANNSPRCIEPV
jgi:putative SOS response-associated peptidase YedK